MKELWKTLTFVAVALVLTGFAYLSTRDRSATSAEFADQGKPLFPEFTDPLACTDLEVVDFDASTATASRFRVMFKDKKWVIPSHYNYPADAKDRLAKTAGDLMDLSKDTIRSDSPEEEAAMGVIDPLDAKVTSLQGRGKRITLRDASEKVLADIIIGNEIKGIERKEGSLHYVRVPDQRRTYGVHVKAEPSTKFADWIETNLLKVESSRIRKIFFDNYKIQEERSSDPTDPRSHLVLKPGEKLTITRKDSAGSWTMADLPADKQLNDNNLRTLVDAVADLKIVGIRPRPAGLKNLDQEGLRLTQRTMDSLIAKGYFVTRSGLYSDQGDVIVSTDEGVVYTLRYGGPVFAEGDELIIGHADDAEQKKDEKAKKDDKTKPELKKENRYLMVTVAFDPAMIPKPESMEPKPFVPPAGPVKLPDNVFAPDSKDPKYLADQKEAKEKADRDKADYEKKIADGEKKVKELADRFGAWYYVTPGDSFRSINLDTTAVLEPKKPPDAAGTTPGASPPGP
jgi:hypothetical protein